MLISNKMQKANIVNTQTEGERVTSIYAETYLQDDHCEVKSLLREEPAITTSQLKEHEEGGTKNEWVSPSDLLIGILDLKAPFTSKINRGTAHQGILDIGDDVLEVERIRFLKYITNVIHENDAAWNYILEHEKSAVAKKVKAIYQDILTTKSKTLMEEINIFYENSLQELEEHIRSEVQTVLIAAHTKIISDLNIEMKKNLENERIILENNLKKRYESEIDKIKHYYKLLLDNEIYRNDKLVKQAIYERNDALKAFYSQIEAQNITSTMYMMCTERKRCRIRQFILDNIQNTELAEKQAKIKERQTIIDALKQREQQISDINKAWEDKIKKILQLFLKFVSFSLKLLPEQSTFLLDLEQMVVLQLNEIKKSPLKTTPILVDDEDYRNILKFEEPEKNEPVCDKEPFVIEGDLSSQTGPQYGSRETLTSDVDLPYIRLQRKFIYAKCQKMDEVRAFLESKRCKCRDPIPQLPCEPSPSPSKSSEASIPIPIETKTPPEIKTESQPSFETMLMDDVHILQNCPVRRCQDWTGRHSFPYLNSYLDFTEDNYTNVKTLLGTPRERDLLPDLIDPKLIISKELPFAPTKEKYHNVETQYSSQEDIIVDFKCPCMGEDTEAGNKIKDAEINEMDEIMVKRKNSVRRILNKNPNLLKMFTDESFDFVYTIN